MYIFKKYNEYKKYWLIDLIFLEEKYFVLFKINSKYKVIFKIKYYF